MQLEAGTQACCRAAVCGFGKVIVGTSPNKEPEILSLKLKPHQLIDETLIKAKREALVPESLDMGLGSPPRISFALTPFSASNTQSSLVQTDVVGSIASKTSLFHNSHQQDATSVRTNVSSQRSSVMRSTNIHCSLSFNKIFVSSLTVCET